MTRLSFFISAKLLVWFATTFGICIGLDFTLSKDADGDACGMLRCYGNNLPGGTRSILAMKIYDVMNSKKSLLASVSNVSYCSRDLDTSTLLKLEISLQQGSQCDGGSFMCQLNYVNSEGEVDVEVSFIKPDEYCLDPMKGWTLAFRGTARIKQSVYDAYTTNKAKGQAVEPGCEQVTSPLPCTHHYRNSSVLDNWTNINEVAFIVYKNITEVKRVVFDGRGTTNMNWFRQDRIKTSSWTDLATESSNFFSIDGWFINSKEYSFRRRFFMNHAYNGCPEEVGWFVVQDADTRSSCQWENYPEFPVFKYSTCNRFTNWNSENVDVADVFAVFVR